MITTLLKHEWLRTRGMLGAIVGIAALVALVGTGLTALQLPILAIIGQLVTIVTLAMVVPVIMFALTIDYWRSSYGRTGYFTQSLPLRGSTIYFAKLLWGCIVTVASMIATALLFGVFWFGIAPSLAAPRNPFVALGDFWNGLMQVTTPAFVLGAAAALVVSYLIWLVQLYFAASIGSQSPLNRMGVGGPVLVFIGLYFVAQIALFAGIVLIPLGIGVVGGQLAMVEFSILPELMTGATTDDSAMPLGFVPPLVLLTLVCLVWTTHSWNRKISLA